MLTANLLPKEEIQINIYNRFCRIIIFFALLLASVFIGGSVLLLPSYMPMFQILKEHNRALAMEEEAAKRLTVREIRGEIESISAALAWLQPFFERPPPASAILENFFSRAQNITITSLVIDKTGNVTLQGRAAARHDLLLFEKLLRESEFLQDVSLPLSQIIRETNISFALQGKLKPGKQLRTHFNNPYSAEKLEFRLQNLQVSSSYQSDSPSSTFRFFARNSSFSQRKRLLK